MFCIPTHHEHHHQPRRILHGFRSHRSLRAEAAAARDEMHHPHHHHHHRNPSDVSSMARSSTDSARSPASRSEFFSVEWDPLRLHPPMAVGPGPMLPTTLDDSRRYQPHELRQARSMHFQHNHLNRLNHDAQTQARAALHSHSQSAPALVIYGGFDFGFGSNMNSRGQEALSPSSPSSASGSEAVTPNSCRDAFEWVGADKARPRPNPAGVAGPDHFIKRGDWKRRGIVFASDAPAASEDECFDLEMDF